jgi:hypothetical protein
VLEAFDAVTDCLTIDASFDVGDVAELCSIIDPNATDIDRGAVYDLDQHYVEEINAHFSIQLTRDP